MVENLESRAAWAVELIDTQQLIRIKARKSNDAVERGHGMGDPYLRISGYDIQRIAKGLGLDADGDIGTFTNKKGETRFLGLEDVELDICKPLDASWEPESLKVAMDDRGLLHLELVFEGGGGDALDVQRPVPGLLGLGGGRCEVAKARNGAKLRKMRTGRRIVAGAGGSELLRFARRGPIGPWR